MRVVVGHANPDFDAYAATVAAVKLFPGAVGVYLGSQNRNVREFHNMHEEFLGFADLKGLDLGAIEQLVMVDTRDPDRIGEFGGVARDPAVEVVVYDHHPPSDADLRDADDRSREAGSTTAILVHEIRERGIDLTPLEASLMLLGVHEDTGSLTYPNTTTLDAEAVTFLMGVGGDLEVLSEFLAHPLSPEQRALLDRLVGALETWDVNGQEISVAHVGIDQYVDSASVVTHYLSEDMGFRVVIAAVSMPDRVHVVGRSRMAEVDMGAVLAHLGGGGHNQAASASLRQIGDAEVLRTLRRALEAEVRPPRTAADIGSTPVRAVEPSTSMAEAGEIMRRWGHGGLPVVDRGLLVGLVTRKDVDKAQRHGLEHAPVKGFMSRDIITVPPETDLATLERMMSREAIGRIPVMDEGSPVAIVTRKDVLRAKHGDGYLDRRMPQARSDASERFLAAVESVLPERPRRVMVELGRLADEMGVQAHAVGGFVRDMLLERENLDVDIVVEGDGVAFAEAAAERLGGRVRAHRRFATAVLVVSRTLHVDIASARTEYYSRPGALPSVERSSLRQDLLRRDFSVNAMAACVNPASFGAIADPFGGLRDLEKGRIRVLHSLSFVEDPTRVFRAARFEQRFGFEIEESTEVLARRCVGLGLLDEVSGTRIRAELFEILDEERVWPALRRLHDLGALASVMAEHADPVLALEEIGRVEASLAKLPGTMCTRDERAFALALPLVGHTSAHEAEKWARWLRLSRGRIDAAALVAERLDGLLRTLNRRVRMRDSAVAALLRPLGPEPIAYAHAVAPGRARRRVERYVLELAQVEAAVGGEDLIAMGLTPGPAFSAILDQALSDRLDGVAVGREAELENLRVLASEAGALVNGRPRGGD